MTNRIDKERKVETTVKVTKRRAKQKKTLRIEKKKEKGESYTETDLTIVRQFWTKNDVQAMHISAA